MAAHNNNNQKIPLYSAFTTAYNGISNVLVNEVLISPAFDPKTNKVHPPTKQYKAIWDTGATASVITKKVVTECDLKPIGMTKVHHAQGVADTYIYLVNIILRNNVGVKQVRVTEGVLAGENEVLIGMDIIARGDFAVSNFQGKTTFTFRIPSIETIDYVNRKKNEPFKRTSVVGRNETCPCGSRKKYKKCCGQ